MSQSLFTALLLNKVTLAFNLRHKCSFLIGVCRLFRSYSPVRVVTFTSKDVSTRPNVINTISIIPTQQRVSIPALVTVWLKNLPKLPLAFTRPPVVNAAKVQTLLNQNSFRRSLQLFHSSFWLTFMELLPLVSCRLQFCPFSVIGITGFQVLPNPDRIIPIKKVLFAFLCTDGLSTQSKEKNYG